MVSREVVLAGRYAVADLGVGERPARLGGAVGGVHRAEAVRRAEGRDRVTGPVPEQRRLARGVQTGALLRHREAVDGVKTGNTSTHG